MFLQLCAFLPILDSGLTQKFVSHCHTCQLDQLSKVFLYGNCKTYLAPLAEITVVCCQLHGAKVRTHFQYPHAYLQQIVNCIPGQPVRWVISSQPNTPMHKVKAHVYIQNRSYSLVDLIWSLREPILI
jgi:hypothetical protein